MYKIAQPTPRHCGSPPSSCGCTEQIVLGVSALPDVARIQPHCIEINRLENEADEISRAAIAALFYRKRARPWT